MKKRLYSFIYYRLLGWKTNVTVPNYDKCVICAAPHTSNWDLFIGKLFYGAIGRKTSFMMKKEWFFFPLGLIFRAIGGIPVDRSRNTSLVDQMANRFAGSKLFHLAITPEGTRKSNPNWKKRFLLHCVESTSSYHAYRYRLSYQDYNFHQGNNANGRL